VFVRYLKDLRAKVAAGKPLDGETVQALLGIAEGGWDLMNSANDRMSGQARGSIQAGFRRLDGTKKTERMEDDRAKV
jgi:hypothetical protein